jgi:hypothetical protein
MNRCLLVLWVVLASCEKSSTDGKSRASLRRLGASTFELVPGENQLPYCLAFTHSARGITRQLTMNDENVSFDCPTQKPIGDHAFRAPLKEGPVKIWILFSSDRVNAASVAQQLTEQVNLSRISTMDLRLPGRAKLETIDFTPMSEVVATEGAVVTRNNWDAGTPPSHPDAATVAPANQGSPQSEETSPKRPNGGAQ